MSYGGSEKAFGKSGGHSGEEGSAEWAISFEHQIELSQYKLAAQGKLCVTGEGSITAPLGALNLQSLRINVEGSGCGGVGVTKFMPNAPEAVAYCSPAAITARALTEKNNNSQVSAKFSWAPSGMKWEGGWLIPAPTQMPWER